MSKLSFRARALDPTKPMPIYLAEELPDLPEYSAINRAVPRMPSGMEKEEESEHHLQRAICTGLIIPTPEVFEIDYDFYNRNYPANFKVTKQLIHMQPLGLEQDIPDYDMDSADEAWVNQQSRRLDLTPLKFEQMMDRLEKSSGQTVITLNEAKALLKQDDEISIAVYDYWLNKRLRLQHPLILSVRTENRVGAAPNNPYLAFRRRTEKMQTRKNRKNDETSYEKMLKLRRDLSRAVTLLELIKRREKTKREHLHLSIEVYEKRYQAKDFTGQLMSEYSSNVVKSARPAFTPIYANQYSHTTVLPSGTTQSSAPQWSGNHHQFSATQYHSTTSSTVTKRDVDAASGSSVRKEKRQYKKRKHKTQRDKPYPSPGVTAVESMVSSDEEEATTPNILGTEAPEDEGQFPFRRSKSCQYHKPLTKEYGNWPWASKEENGMADPKYRFTLTSIRQQRPRCIGFARRRMGRGGRVILDRISTSMDDVWSKLDFTIYDSEEHNRATTTTTTTKKTNAENGEGDATTETSSVVVDLVTNRKNSIDSVARTTKTLSWSGSENIVIKNEQNNTVAATTTVKQEKMDDYDSHLTRLSSYSSNLSLGRLSSGIGSQTSIISDVLSQSLIQSNSFNSVPYSQPTLSADRSELLQQRIGEFAANIANIKSEQPDADDDLYGKDDDDQMYSEFLDEIRRDWLHFRPKTPVECADNKTDFGIDPIQYTETTPLAIEIQRLSDEAPSMGLFDSPDDDNHLFVTNPFSLDEIMDDEMHHHHHSQHENSLSGTDHNLSGSGDSLPELSLSLGETEDNEMLDNILQEVQLDDLKSFNANPNFWNGLLEETAELCDVIDGPKKMSLDVDDRFGIGSIGRKDKRKSHRNQRIGSSTFNLSNLRSDEFFKKEDPPQQPSGLTTTAHDGNLITSEMNIDKPLSTDVASRKIKEELMDVVVEPQLTIKSENLPVIKTEIVHSTLTMPNVGISKPVNQLHPQQHQLQHQQSLTLTTGDNSLVMQPMGPAPIRRHTNGPTDKAVIQNLLKQVSVSNRKFQIQQHHQQQQQQLRTDPIDQDVKPKIVEGTAYLKMASFPSEFNVVATNNLAFNASTIAANHNYSLAPQSSTIQHQQPITLIGQSPQSHNKFILSAATPSQTDPSITYAAQPIHQDIQNKITIPSSNIKVNLMPATMGLNTIGADGKTTVLATASHPQLSGQQLHQQQQHQQQQHQSQQNRKTVNMLYDSDKNRILYNTNIKNSRGQQIFAQLNSSKVLNILPIQHKNNASGTVQSIVTPGGLLNKAQTVQRISTMANTQTISSIRQQNITTDMSSVAATVTASASTGGSTTNESLTKFIQNSGDAGPTATTVNLNTTNR